VRPEVVTLALVVTDVKLALPLMHVFVLPFDEPYVQPGPAEAEAPAAGAAT
jgi:hypothetical protein